MAALSTAYLKGIIVEHQREAIQEMISYLQENQINDDFSSNIWLASLEFNVDCKNILEIISDFYNDGWCYDRI